MRSLWPLLLLLGAASDAAVVGEWRVSFLRGTTVLQYSSGLTEAAAWAACLAKIPQVPAAGAMQVYACQNARYIATVTQSAPPRPPDDIRPGVCSGATTGVWTQTRSYTSAPAPTYWTAGAWLPATPPPGVCVSVVTGSATFSWVPPTKNTDGTPLTNLTSYKLYYGSSATSMPNSVPIPAPAIRHVLTGLTPGPLYARMTAVNSAGRESALSNTVSVP